MRSLVALVLVSLSLSGCGGAPPAPGTVGCDHVPVAQTGLQRTVRPFLNGTDLAGNESRGQVERFACSESWHSFCDGRQKGREGCPEVDFSHDSVIVVWASQQPTTGYRVNITGVDETGGDWVVFYKLLLPVSTKSPATCAAGEMESRPYQAALFSRAFSEPSNLRLHRQSNGTFEC